MSIADRYLHTATVKRMVATGSTDEYGQPVATETTVATIACLVQPRRAREVELASQAGAVVADYVGYTAPLAGLDTDCWLLLAGVRYDILAMPDAAGIGHHLELSLRRVD